MFKLQEFINRLKIGYKCRSTSIKLLYNNGFLKILFYFWKKGLIRHYIIKNNEIIVYLRYLNNKPLFNNIKVISTKGYRRYLSKKGLKFYKRWHGRNSLILLYTSKGLLTLEDAEYLNLGGELSFIFFD